MASELHVGDEESRGHDDRLSDLPDHILLCVLERLVDDVRSLARASLLSKRFRTLPLMLPELEISATTFYVPANRSTTPSKLQRLIDATGRFAAAVRFFLGAGDDSGDLQRRATIKTLNLKLYLTEVHYLHETIRLVGDAIGRGEVRDLELVVYTETGKNFLGAEPRRQRISLCYGHRFRHLLRDAPAAVPWSLKKLTLYNLCFKDPSSELGTLLGACTALEILALDYCGFYDGDLSSTLAVDAPADSRLKVLCFDDCYFGRVHLVQAPRLACLTFRDWCSESCPVMFGPGSVPSLQEIVLSNGMEPWQVSFSLSELLENTRGVATVHLAFDNNKIWVRPEGPKNLGAAFSNLKVLRLMSIFPESELSWTMFLLQTAPRLEFVDIEVYRKHVCRLDDADDNKDDDSWDDIQDPEWEVPQGFRHRHLQCLRVRGGIDAGKHGRFARLVMERAVSLELLVLDARIMCEGCIDAQRLDPSIVLSKFPEDKEGVDALVRRQVKGGIASSARVLVHSTSNQEFQY